MVDAWSSWYDVLELKLSPSSQLLDKTVLLESPLNAVFFELAVKLDLLGTPVDLLLNVVLVSSMLVSG